VKVDTGALYHKQGIKYDGDRTNSTNKQQSISFIYLFIYLFILISGKALF